MRIICATTVIAILTGPAYAQGKPSTTIEELMNAKSPEQIEKERAAERAYKESLKKIPDAKTASDPWGNARGVDAPKAAAKTPASKKSPAKTGVTTN